MKFTLGILSTLLVLQHTPSYCSEHESNPHIIKLGRGALPGNHVVHCYQDALYITYTTPSAEPAPIKKIALIDDQGTMLHLTDCNCVVFGINKLRHPDKLHIRATRSTIKAIDLEHPAYEPPGITLCKHSKAWVTHYEKKYEDDKSAQRAVAYYGPLSNKSTYNRPRRSLLLADLCISHPATTSDQ